MVAGSTRLYIDSTGVPLFQWNSNAAVGLQGRNTNSGTLAETKWSLLDDTNASGIILSVPSSGNTAPAIFGISRPSGTFITTVSATRALCMGTYAAASVIVGTNNVARLTIDSAGSATYGYMFSFSKSVSFGDTVINPPRLVFDGSGDYVTIPAVSALSAVSSFSMSMFLTADSLAPGAAKYLYNRLVDANNVISVYVGTTGSLRVTINNGSSSYGSIALSGLLTIGRPHHVGVVYDGSGSTNADKLKIYFDGVLQTLTFSGTLPATTPTLGTTNHRISEASTNAWAGIIADFRIYSSALTAANILALSQGVDFSTGCVRRYKLIDGVGTTVTDYGTDAQNGTITGATWGNSIYISHGTLIPKTRISLPAGTTLEDGISAGNDTYFYRSSAGVWTVTNLAATGQLSGATAKFGGPTHYSEFEADGTYKANGDATTWDDVYPSAVTVGVGSNAPAFTTYSGNYKAYEFVGSSLTKEIHMNFQIPHPYKESSTISPHIHIYVPNDASGGTIKFYCECSWLNVGGTEPASATISGTLTIGANAGNLGNEILGFGTLIGTGKTISSLLKCRIYRDPTDPADTFGSSVWLMSADVHIEQDTLGSRAILTK